MRLICGKLESKNCGLGYCKKKYLNVVCKRIFLWSEEFNVSINWERLIWL